MLIQTMYLNRKLNTCHLLLQLFDKRCLEKHSKEYILILYTKRRRGTVFSVMKRTNNVNDDCAKKLGQMLNASLGVDICNDF